MRRPTDRLSPEREPTRSDAETRTVASAPADGPGPVSPWSPGGGATVTDGEGPSRPNLYAPELVPGGVIDGRYRLIKRLGEGGMGEVWEVSREGLHTPLALKVLKSSGASDVQLERFLREARAVGMLSHEGIVSITDYGETRGGLPYFVMERIPGRPLNDVLREDGPIAWPRLKGLLLQIADALDCAHRAGIIHRDLKPANVFAIGEPGSETIKIIDFGIAKFSEVHEDLRTLTQTGVVQGTPAFMSPEQARGDKVDARTDQYSLAAMAYYLLSGKLPFSATNTRDVLFKQLFTHPDPLRDVVPDLPESVEAVVFRAMRKDPGLRFEDMPDMARALQAMGESAIPVEVPEERLTAERLAAGGGPAPTHTTGAALMTTREAPARERTAPTVVVRSAEPTAPSRAPVFVGIGVAIALGGGAAAWLAMPKDASPPAQPPVTQPVPVAKPPAADGAPVPAHRSASPPAVPEAPARAAEPEPEPEPRPEAPPGASRGKKKGKKKGKGKGKANKADAPRPLVEDPAMTNPWER